jgi:hypothetical protein
VFLELSIDYYLAARNISLKFVAHGGRRVDKTLKVKIEEAIDDLVAQRGLSPKDFLTVKRGLSDAKSPLYIDLLHAYIHNLFVTPKSRELVGAWNDAERFLEELWK